MKQTTLFFGKKTSQKNENNKSDNNLAKLHIIEVPKCIQIDEQKPFEKQNNEVIQQIPSINDNEQLNQSYIKDVKNNKTNENLKMKENQKNLKKLLNKNYHPIDDAPFEIGSDIPFSFITNAFDECAELKGENSSLLKKDILCNMFRTIKLINKTDLPITYYFCILRLAPDYANLELGVGNEILLKAISKACGRSPAQLRNSLNEIGDLGLVASNSKSSQSNMDKFLIKKKAVTYLTIKRVFENFMTIATLKGNKVEEEKESIIIKLLMDSKGTEPIYLVRWIQKNFKIGAAEATMQSALSKAFFMTPNLQIIDHSKSLGKEKFESQFENFEKIIKRAISEYPNQEVLINCLIEVEHDIDQLLNVCKITPGIPVKPMLAKPTKDISVIFKRFENMKFTCEFKYDGLRGQVHYLNGNCQIFSRNQLNMTETYPDIIEFIKDNIPQDVENFIMDTEIVAIDKKSNRILPFQVLSNRSRKNVDKDQIEVAVCLFMFDLLYLNGKSLLQEQLQQRRNQIYQHFKEVEGKLAFVMSKDTDDFEQIEDFLTLSVKMGCEGLMVKTLDENSSYEPCKRSFKWLKMKKDYIDKGLGDSFDLVPIAAFHGTGKRTGQYGSFLLACYNEDIECYETICKIGTGFSEEILLKIYESLKENIIKEPLPEYKIKDFEADVWFTPCQVWEIKGADIQISPVYTTAVNELGQGKGLGMRFPRLLRIREDKKPEDATTTEFIYDIYKSQAAVQNQDFNDDEGY